MLRGKTVVVTRPAERAQAWVDAFAAAGANVVACPVIELSAVSGPSKKAALSALGSFREQNGWLAFTSVPGVERATALLREAALFAPAVTNARVASVGPLTTRALTDEGWRVEVEPDESTAAALARQILVRDPKPRVVHPTSNRGRVELCREVNAAGGECTQVVVYENSPRTDFTPREQRLLAGECDLLAFASPTAVVACVAAAAGSRDLLQTPVVCVGETTAAAARADGFRDVRVATRPHAKDVVAAAAR
ncbi:MAG: uroporphyrinogen-III synthase [Planctomycetota bacterium]